VRALDLAKQGFRHADRGMEAIYVCIMIAAENAAFDFIAIPLD
jgi:hypothetical protein